MSGFLLVIGIVAFTAAAVWLVPYLAHGVWRWVRDITFLAGIVILAGFVIPPASIVLGLFGGWVFDSVALARVVMGIGILIGLLTKVMIGIAAVTLANILFDAFRGVFRRTTREDVGEILEGYAGALSWTLVAEELSWLLAPYAPLWAIFLGVLIAATIVSMVVGWNLPVTKARQFAFRFQMALLVLIFAVAVKGFYDREVFFAQASRPVAENAWNIENERERALRTAEVADIAARIANPRSSSVFIEAMKRGFADQKVEQEVVNREYRRAREEMRHWEDRGYPRPVRWLRSAWRELIE